MALSRARGRSLKKRAAAHPGNGRPGAGRLAWALAICCMIAFWPVFSARFLRWDDLNTVAFNPDFNPPSPAHWGHYWTAPAAGLYMPMTYMFWGIVSGLCELAGSHVDQCPAAFHAASVALQAADAILIFYLFRKLVGSDWPAFFGALLYAVHPVQVEVVAWITETSVLLSTAFSVLALLEFSHFADAKLGVSPPINPIGKPQVAKKSPTPPWLHYTLATSALIVALLCKPSAVVVPLLAGTIEITLRQRPLRKLLAPLGLWCLLCIPIAVVQHYAQQIHFTAPIWQRPIVAADAVAFYLYTLFLPIRLLAVYNRTPAWLFAHPMSAGLTWIAPAALAILCAACWRKRRWVAAAGLIFLLALLPVLGLNPFAFQQISTTADRYMSLAMLGPALAVACAMPARPSRAVLTIAGIFGALLIAMSFCQASYWHDTFTLFSRAAQFHPDNSQVQEMLGTEYNLQSHRADELGQPDEGRRLLETALDHFIAASKLPYDDGEGDYNAADCLARLNRVPEAMKYCEASLQDPHCIVKPKAYDELGLCEQAMGDRLKAADYFHKALDASAGKPGWADVYARAQKHLDQLSKFRIRAAQPG